MRCLGRAASYNIALHPQDLTTASGATCATTGPFTSIIFTDATGVVIDIVVVAKAHNIVVPYKSTTTLVLVSCHKPFLQAKMHKCAVLYSALYPTPHTTLLVLSSIAKPIPEWMNEFTCCPFLTHPLHAY